MKKGLLALMALAAISQEMSSTRKEEKIFRKGDVIIRDKDGSMMILDSIIENTSPLLPIKFKVPYGYISYVPQNEEGNRFFITETPECGIGNIDGFRLATEKKNRNYWSLQKMKFILISILRRTSRNTYQLPVIYVFSGTMDIKTVLV